MKRYIKFKDITKHETFVKGFSHRTRLEILFYLESKPNSELSEIQKHINSTQQNTTNHVNKMKGAKLIWKKQKGTSVLHRLSPRGETVAMYLRNIERIFKD